MPKIDEMTQEDVDRMQAALDNFKTENQKFREQRDEYKAQLDNPENNEVAKRFKERAIKAEAKVTFSALGVKDADRFMKYIDLSKVTVGDDDKIAGLDEEVTRIKGDFPEVFDARRRVGGKVDAAANNPGKVEKTPTDLQLEALGF